MHYLHRYKIVFVFFLIINFNSWAQSGSQHNPNYDNQKFHFGLAICPNYDKAKVTLAANFLQRDSVQSIRTQGFSGFGFGGLVDYRIGKFATVRYTPQIQFSQRNFVYTIKDGLKNNIQTYRVETAKSESVALEQSFDLKYHSVRHKNIRFFVLAGLKYSYDFRSDEKAQRGPNRPLVPFKEQSFYYEYGFGIDYFGLWKVISTEIKMGNSITNMISKDQYIYTSSIDKIQLRLFQLSFYFQ